MSTRKILLIMGFVWVMFLTTLYALGDAQAQDAAGTAGGWSILAIILIWIAA